MKDECDCCYISFECKLEIELVILIWAGIFDMYFAL